MTDQPLALTGFSDEIVVDRAGLSPDSQPISIAFLPDDRMLLVSKTGEIRIVDPETGSNALYMQLVNIDVSQERGLLDITLDPQFETNGHFYLYYTPASPEAARIARFTHQENAGGLTSSAGTDSEFVVWEDIDGYPRCCHYGGGLDFGPDGKLWLTTSDKFSTSAPGEGNNDADLPVKLHHPSGKVIRVNPDGTVPDGSDGWPANPFVDGQLGDNDGNDKGTNEDDNVDAVWAYGLRNPFRARWDEEYGQFYIAEVGGNQQDISHEDLHLANLGSPGVFYGWPYYEGVDDTLVNDQPARTANPLPGDPDFSTPIWSLPHDNLLETDGTSASITGGEVYRGEMFPAEWDGVYFYGDYTRDYIRYLVLDETGTRVLGDHAFRPSSTLPGDTNEVVSISVGTDGALYYAMIASGEVHRVTHGLTNQAPEILEATLTPADGEPPLSVTFEATVTDAEGDAMTYRIDFGDGTVAMDVVPPDGRIEVDHLYGRFGFYDVSMTLSDPGRKVFSDPFEVMVGDVNDAPVIVDPASDTPVAEAGETVVTFTATATDADGDQMSYTWYFGDGSSESGTVAAGSVATASHVYAADNTYAAYLEVDDGEEVVESARVRVQVGGAGGVPVTEGLTLLLESDIKIGLEGSTVTSWLDGGGNGLNLTAEGDPQLVAGQTPSGRPAIVFDGAGDLLRRDAADGGLSVLPAGNADRTIFAVIDYIDPERRSAGVVYGDDEANETFGLVANKAGRLAIQGYANDFDSGVQGVSGGYMVQSAVLSGGTTSHFRDGVLIDSDANAFATDPTKLVLGAEIGGKGAAQMGIAAVLIYDRALAGDERQQVEAFLQGKYLTALPQVSTPPAAADDAVSVVQDGSVLIDVMANDSDADGDAFAISEVTTAAHGTAVVDDGGTPGDPSDDRVLYTPDSGFAGQDEFLYTIAGDDGIDTGEVVVTVTPPPVSTPPVAADDTAAVAQDGSVLIDVLANDADADGDPFSISGITDPAHGTATVDDSGTPGDPSDDRVLYVPDAGYEGDDAFTYTIAGDDGTDGATVSVTVDAPGGGGGVPVTAGMVAAYEADENVSLVGGDKVAGWLDGSGRGNDLVAGGDPTLVAGATPTGQAAISFDGAGDMLERVNATDTLSGLPSGSAARTLFFVVDHHDTRDGLAGFAYGDSARNQTFGLTADGSDGSLVLQGYGRRNDVDSGVAAGGWMVQSAVLDGTGFDHYLDGERIDGRARTYATDLERLVIGEEIGGRRQGEMDVAAAFVFDRALADAEREAMEIYLQQKYIDDDFIFA